MIDMFLNDWVFLTLTILCGPPVLLVIQIWISYVNNKPDPVPQKPKVLSISTSDKKVQAVKDELLSDLANRSDRR